MEKQSGEESEADEGCVDEVDAGCVAEALKGKDAGRQDFQADEADGWCAAPAGVPAWYRPGASTLSLGFCLSDAFGVMKHNYLAVILVRDGG
jgi:hypothetical protein